MKLIHNRFNLAHKDDNYAAALSIADFLHSSKYQTLITKHQTAGKSLKRMRMRRRIMIWTLMRMDHRSRVYYYLTITKSRLDESRKNGSEAERSLARLGTPQARTWHAMGTREACHHHAIHMPRRATLVPPLCPWHANLVPRPAPLCAGRGAHLACPWRAGGLSLTFTQPSLFAIAMLPTPKPMQLGPQKLNYCCSPQVHC